MASILNFPNEILVKIAGHLGSLRNINHFARTNHHCYAVLNRHLYFTASSGVNLYDSGLVWVVEHGRLETLQHFIDAGALAGPDSTWQIQTLLKLGATHRYIYIVKTLFNYGSESHADFNLQCGKALVEAIKVGFFEAVDFLLSNGVKSDFPPGHEDSVIDIAIQGNSAEIIKILSSHGVNFTQLGPHKSTALHIAIKTRKSNVIEALLQCGLDPNATDNDGNAPIHFLGAFAYRSGNYSRGGQWAPGINRPLSQVLLEYGADPYLKDQYGFMPLWIASYTASDEETAALLEHGVDPNGLDRECNPQSPLPLKDFKGIYMSQRLSSHHRGMDGQRNSCSPLCIAAYYGDCWTVDVLLEYGADPNRPDNNGDLPLHLAVLSRRDNVIKSLVKGGSSLDAKNGLGQTALGLAVVLGGPETVKALLEGGTNIHSASFEDVDPIFRALEYGHSDYGRNSLLPPKIFDAADARDISHRCERSFECTCCPDLGEPHRCERVLKSFLDHGSKLDSRDMQGRTVLHQAAFQLCIGGINFLLEQGADPMAKDSFGQIPLHMTCCLKLMDDEKTEAFEKLLEGGSDPNSKDINGNTPLHLAARGRFAKGVRFLRLNRQADFTAQNNRSNTPLHEAVDLKTGIADEDTVIELRKGIKDFTLVNNDGETVWGLAQKYPEDGCFDDVNDALSCELIDSGDDSESEIGSDEGSDEAIRLRMEVELSIG